MRRMPVVAHLHWPLFLLIVMCVSMAAMIIQTSGVISRALVYLLNGRTPTDSAAR